MSLYAYFPCWHEQSSSQLVDRLEGEMLPCKTVVVLLVRGLQRPATLGVSVGRSDAKLEALGLEPASREVRGNSWFTRGRHK